MLEYLRPDPGPARLSHGPCALSHPDVFLPSAGGPRSDTARAPMETARRGSRDVIDLTETNPTRAGFAYPDLHSVFAGIDLAAYDPDPRGLAVAREAIAADYARRGVHVAPNRILLTASSSESYGYLFKVLCDPGDSVLVPVPSYPLFDHLAGLEAVRLVPYRLEYHDAWRLDVDDLAGRLDDRVRAMLVVSPNNPTGSVLRRADLRSVGRDLCRAATRTDRRRSVRGLSDRCAERLGGERHRAAEGAGGLAGRTVEVRWPAASQARMDGAWRSGRPCPEGAGSPRARCGYLPVGRESRATSHAAPSATRFQRARSDRGARHSERPYASGGCGQLSGMPRVACRGRMVCCPARARDAHRRRMAH